MSNTDIYVHPSHERNVPVIVQRRRLQFHVMKDLRTYAHFVRVVQTLI